jgi:putative spermidine/putrescine transport system permease protein
MKTLAWLGQRLFLVLVYIFVLGPAAVILIDSFNSATSFPSPFESATLRWYLRLLSHEEFHASMRISAVVATCAALIATALAIFAAYALVRYPLRGKNALVTFMMGPLLVPQIIIGLAMLQLLGLLGIRIGIPGLVAVHAVYVMPFALRLVMASLARFDFALEEAAQSLGAGRLRTLWHVTLPVIRPGLASGFIFAFILSFVNLPVSLFLTSPQTATLPIVMFSYMEQRLDPLIAAVASAVLIATVIASLILERVFRLRLIG